MSDIIKATDEFVLTLFKEKLPNTFVYHNYRHTKRVYKSINEIIEDSQINVKDATILKLAALLQFARCRSRNNRWCGAMYHGNKV